MRVSKSPHRAVSREQATLKPQALKKWECNGEAIVVWNIRCISSPVKGKGNKEESSETKEADCADGGQAG